MSTMFVKPKEKFKQVIDMVRDHYSNMIDIPKDKKDQIREWVNGAERGDEAMKLRLITDVETYLNGKGIYLEESMYPETTPYESIIYATYGLGVYDAVIHLSPFVESVIIITGQPVRYYESGKKKPYYGYIPMDEEVEAIQRKLSEISERPLHKTQPVVAGFIEATETRLQLYVPPFSYERSIVTRRFITNSFSLYDVDMDERSREFCKQVVYGRLNVGIAGGMGVGKTQRQISMLLLKDPETDTITTWESEFELRLSKKWRGNVIALQSIEDIGYTFADISRHIFRNNSETVVFAEVRSPIEGHYSLESCLRGVDATYFSIHLNIPTVEAAIRTYASLINGYRKDNIINVYRDIADGIDLFWLLANYNGKRVDECIFIPTFEEGYVSRNGDYVPGRVKGKVLAKYNRASGKLEWTGEKLPDRMVEKMIYMPANADLEVLKDLGLTDYRRMV